MRKANGGRGTRVAEDLAAMRELNVARLPEYVEEAFRVSEWSTPHTVDLGAYDVLLEEVGT